MHGSTNVKRFYLLQHVQTGSGANPATFLIGARVLSWGSSGQDVRADHSTASRGNFKLYLSASST